MLNDKQLNDILFQYSNFFRDFLPSDDALSKMVQMYAQVVTYAWEVYQEAEDSRFITSTRTLRTIPYYKVNIDQAIYDLNTARILSRKSIEEKIAYLDDNQLYTPFTFEKKDSVGEPTVESLRLFVNFGDEMTGKSPLKLGEDYFLRSNRLYLFPAYIQSRKKTLHYLHAFDVKVNDKTLEKNFGTIYNLETGPLLPRHEYRDVLEAFSRSMKGDMTIRQLKEAIQLSTKWTNFRVEDRLSPTLSKRKKQLYEDWIISPNKFIVSLPEYLISAKVKQNIVRSLLAEIKEQDKDYMLFFEILRNDLLPTPMKAWKTMEYRRGEKLTPEDVGNLHHLNYQFVEFWFSLYGRYDAKFAYDLSLQYDDPPALEVISLHLSGLTLKDEVRCQEGSVEVIVYSDPMIPRNFTAVKNTDTTIRFSLTGSPDSATQYELYAANEKDGVYELVETINKGSAGSKLSFQHQANLGGKRYYKTKAKSPNQQSLFTLPIDVQAL